MYSRNNQKDLTDAIEISPIVLINGARQVGKSTLAKMIISINDKNKIFTLDDLNILSQAKQYPKTFIEDIILLNPNAVVVIDEIQRAPELFLPLKQYVDSKTTTKFIITGSANIFALPKLADSLAGRMEIHQIWPLSQGEIRGKIENFIDICFSDERFYHKENLSWIEIVNNIYKGGYPRILNLSNQRRNFYLNSYLTSMIERDIKDIADIESTTSLPKLLQLLATRVGGILNFADLSNITKIPYSTLKRYISLLEAIFIYVPIPAWYNNEEKRIIKSPKIYFNDTAIICHLRGLSEKKLIENRDITGHILENFIIMELKKQLSWSQIMIKLYHFRTTAGQEIDIILESADGLLVAIEVKSRNDIVPNDFKTIKMFDELTKNKLHRGIILYSGSRILKFGDKYWAVPINCLWET